MSINKQKPLTGNSWGDHISVKRAAQLEAELQRWAREANHGKRRGPFSGIVLTGADVFWLAARSLAGTKMTIAEAEVQLLDAGKRSKREHRLPVSDDLITLIGLALSFVDFIRLSELHLEESELQEAHLEGAVLTCVHLEGANLTKAHLEGANLDGANLEDAQLYWAHLEEASLIETHLERTNFRWGHLKGADLNRAFLEGASFRETHLERTDLRGLEFKNVDLFGAYLASADLRGAFFDSTTDLQNARLSSRRYGTAALANIHLENVDLTQMKWLPLNKLGDERYVGLRDSSDDHRIIMRAFLHIASQLRAQNLNVEADSFLYHAKVRQRSILLRQLQFPQYIGSLFLDLLAGYGYRPGRAIVWYLLTILAFAAAYYMLGPAEGHRFMVDGALVFSVTSFHGRGFFPGSLNLEDTVTKLAALEAIIGLVIEASFIAAFTQRFFGK